MKSVLVTGGAGFIGSHLVRHLLQQQIAVRVLDNLSSGTLDNLRGLETKIDFIEADVRNAVACRQACRNIDVVFHLAALVSVPQSVNDPLQADAINTTGTLNLLLASRDQQVQRFVFSSSAAIYGETSIIPTHEAVLPDPLSPYGVQKLTGEHYARNFTRLYGVPTVCLRYFNVYGPGQNPNSQYAAVIPKFLTAIVSGRSPVVFGDGEQTRDFCSVEDVVAANLLAAQTANAQAFGGVFNVASGTRTSLNTLLAHIRQALDRSLQVRYEAERPGDIRHSGADISRAREVLDYSPRVDLATGLKQTIDYYAVAAKS